MANKKSKSDKGYRSIAAPLSDAGKGWGSRAADYALLPSTNAVFNLSKSILYEIIDKHVRLRGNKIKVLDFNAGCGNDFPYFLERGWRIYACDGAVGMLNEAIRIYKSYIEEGRIHLFHGQAEGLQMDSFDEEYFDLIFSTTGGFAYVDDEEFKREHEVLYNMLKPGGAILTAHLTPFCLGETLYSLLTGRPRKAIRRWKGRLDIKVDGYPYKMYLRSVIRIKELLSGLGEERDVFPVLAFTPPYQTGYKPAASLLKWHQYVEKKTYKLKCASHFADQVAIMIRKPQQSVQNEG